MATEIGNMSLTTLRAGEASLLYRAFEMHDFMEDKHEAQWENKCLTLVNTEQLGRYHLYLWTFLAVNELTLRGSLNAIDSMEEGSSGLFLSMLEKTTNLQKHLAQFHVMPHIHPMTFRTKS